MLNQKESLDLFNDTWIAEAICVELDRTIETCGAVIAAFPVTLLYQRIKHLGKQASRLVRQLHQGAPLQIHNRNPFVDHSTVENETVNLATQPSKVCPMSPKEFEQSAVINGDKQYR
jgi:hypothetical protein